MELVVRLMLLIATIIVLMMVDRVISTESPPRFPNVGYLGSTYNIFKGNPESTKGLDPGFTLRNVYVLTYEQGQETGDHRYSIPDFTNITQSGTCNFNFDSTTTQNTASYTKSLQVHVDVDFSGWGASFSASADYNDIHSGASSSQKIFVSSHATCEAYIAYIISLDRPAPVESTPSIDPGFTNDVYYLPVQEDNDTYFNFIEKWGTHYAYSLRMGGRYGVRSTFLSSDYTDMAASGLDISAAAGYSGMFSINANLTTNIQQNQSEQYEQHRSDYQVYQIGGTPVVSQVNESDPSFQWAQTVKDNPLPIRYTLQTLSSILTAINFPYDKNIAVKQKKLQDIIIEYCLSKLDIDTTLCTANISAEVDTIPVTMVSDYNYIETKSYAQYFGVQQVNTTNTFILGAFLIYAPGYPSNIPAVIVSNPELPSNLIKEAESWEDAFCETSNKNHCVIRPVCPKGYSSISDFFCTDSSSKDACVSTIPRNLPCIADHCLTQCSPYVLFVNQSFNNTQMLIPQVVSGDPYFGNIHFGLNNFFRHMPYDMNGTDLNDLFKCLGYTCLSFV